MKIYNISYGINRCLFIQVGFNGYPHGILSNANELFVNDYTSTSASLGLTLLDNNQFDAQNPLLLRGVEWVFS
jgi:hypothetical protein